MKSIVKFIEKDIFQCLFITLFLLAISVVVTSAESVPYEFEPNDVARAEEVNENFLYLANRSWELFDNNLYYNKGSVGIGTTDPTEKLEVSGTIKATAFVGDGSGLTNISGTIDTDWTESSGNVYRVTGNVGIGTKNPEVKLHIWGGDLYMGGITADIRLWGSTNTDAYFFLEPENDDTGFFDIGVFNKEKDFSDPEAKLRIDAETIVLQSRSTGKVGIGTTEPQAKLHVGGNIFGTHRNWMNNGIIVGDDSDGGYFGVKDEGSNRKDTVIAWGDDSEDNLRFIFNHYDPNIESEIMRLTSIGNVGIGTTSPSEKLEVVGTVRATTFVGDGSNLTGITIPETDPTVPASVKDGTDWTEISNIPSDIADGDDVGITQIPLTVIQEGENISLLNNDAGYLTNYTETDPTVPSTIKDGTDWTEISNIPYDIIDGDDVGLLSETDPKVGNVTTNHISKWNGSELVDSISIFEDPNNGYIGIGTTNPEAKLHVYGVIGADGFHASETDGTYAFMERGIDNDGKVQFGGYHHNGYFTETFIDGNTLILQTKSGGNVGIGTVSPQGKLDVNGSIYQRGSELHADYVFKPEYKLESIQEHAEFMWKKKHLKAIPKAQLDENGQEIIEVGSHQRGIVEELEKAHIYIEQLHKRVKVLEEELSLLKELEAKLARLEKGSTVGQ